MSAFNVMQIASNLHVILLYSFILCCRYGVTHSILLWGALS